MMYRGYKIYPNPDSNPKFPSYNYLYFNTNNCDEPIGAAEFVEDCIKEIDEMFAN